MTDVTTNKKLVVVPHETGPYLMLPLDQVPDLRNALDRRGLRYWVDEQAISYNGAPYLTVVNFGRRGDAKAIQAVLDELP